MKSLVIAAHPDDEVLGVGGTILKRIDEGNEIFVLLLCDCLAPRNTLEIIENLRKTSRKISRKIGVSNLFQLFLGTDENKRLDEIPFKTVIQKIQEIIENVEPDEIFTHSAYDWNTDHKIVFDATISAARTINKFKVKKIYCYEVPSATEQAPNLTNYAFVPNKFIDISEYLEEKLDLLKLYKSEIFEFPHMRSTDAVRMTANLWGAKNGLKAAEAFIVIRDIEV